MTTFSEVEREHNRELKKLRNFRQEEPENKICSYCGDPSEKYICDDCTAEEVWKI